MAGRVYMEENMDKRTSGNDILREAIEDAEIKRVNFDDGDSDTIVFSKNDVKRSIEPEDIIITRSNLNNTAEIKGGAVVRPLKQNQPPPRPGPRPDVAPAKYEPRTQHTQRRIQPTESNNTAVRPTAPLPRQNAVIPPSNPTASFKTAPSLTNQGMAGRSVPPARNTASNQGVQNGNSYGRSAARQSTVNSATEQNKQTAWPSIGGSTERIQSARPGAPLPGSDAARPPAPKPRANSSSPAVNVGTAVPAVKPLPNGSAVPKAGASQYEDPKEKDFEVDTEAEAAEKEKKKAEKKDDAVTDSVSSSVMSVVKAVVYIVAIIAVSIGIAVFAINTANDIFKFVVDEKVVEVEIPQDATLDDVTDILYENGLIKYKWAFKLWTGLKEKDTDSIVFEAGTKQLSTTLNYDYLRSALKKQISREEIRLTIPEGYTVDEIIDLFVSNGIGTKEGFVKAINTYDFNYKFLEGVTMDNGRYYRLEGYLFPDTYNFFKDSTEVAVISKLLDNFNRKFTDEYYNSCAAKGMTVDEVITLASMIEKEARYAADMGKISAVFHNRLNSMGEFPSLQSDATALYAYIHENGKRPEDETYIYIDSPYSTHNNNGLPPGAIANPSINAIKYALYPDYSLVDYYDYADFRNFNAVNGEDGVPKNPGPYYYFVSDTSTGKTYYSNSNALHSEIDRWLDNKKAGSSDTD